MSNQQQSKKQEIMRNVPLLNALLSISMEVHFDIQ